MEEMATPRETHILQRGSYNAPGDKVEPGVPEELLGAWPAGAPKNRLGLARWLTKPDHPLTARVVVNRFWQQIFGQGLVKTSDNFGMQGEWPSHPELLDWLAREFVDSGWNVKALLQAHRALVHLPAGFGASAGLVARDPENRLLARGPRFRLPAELLRDQALAVSGLLKNRSAARASSLSASRACTKAWWSTARLSRHGYVESKGDDLYRRSLYTFWKRTAAASRDDRFRRARPRVLHRQTLAHQHPAPGAHSAERSDVRRGRAEARRARDSGGRNRAGESRLAYAFRLATGRSPDAAERKILSDNSRRDAGRVPRDEARGARKLLAVGESRRDDAVPAAEFAA